MHGNKKLLITGSTGYIGRDLVNRFLKCSTIEIAIVVRDMKTAYILFDDEVKYIQHDSLEKFTEEITSFDPDIVIHLAGYSTSADSAEEVEKLIESNIVFTAQLLLALSKCSIKLFVSAGSFSEYHESREDISPTYFYSATKTSARYMIEYFSNRDGFTFVHAILYSVYGKKSHPKKIVDYVVEALTSTHSVAMSEGYQELDFVHIDDVVSWYYHLVTNYDSLHISRIDYDVGTGISTSIRKLVEITEKLTGEEANIQWGVYKNRKLDTQRACSNITHSVEELGYKVEYTLESGLEKYLKRIGIL